MCKSVSGPIFGLRSEHLSVVFRGIGFIRSQTRRNSTTSTIAEANIDITRSIFVHPRQRSTTYRLKRSSNVALFLAPCKVIQESLGFRIPRCGFGIPCLWIPDSTSMNSGFHNTTPWHSIPETWILDYNYGWIPDPISWIPDSNAVDSGFHRPKLPGFRIPDYLTWGEKFPILL